MQAYDDGNLFNKIIKGDIPCHKIFETDHALAILDAFPLAPGHALLLPKAKCVSVLDMPAEVASAFLAELPRLARLVQRATGAPACNILQNSGKEAGQVVFHCHFHVIPRFENDQAVKLKPPMSKEMLKAEDAKSMLAKMSETTLPYEASLGLLDQLVSAISAGSLTPPLPTAPKGSASKAKAPASSPAPASASAPAAPPKMKEKPMAEAAVGGGGSGASNSGGGEKKPKANPRKEVAPATDAGAEVGDVLDISWADIRVGKIVDAVPHPESDKLYVETIDLGDGSPRQILSGLAHHMSLDKVKGAMVVCICNLKARKLGGMESNGMVLCASTPDKSVLSFVTPPAGAAPGERVMFDGFPGGPAEVKKFDKKKAWEVLAPDLNTGADGVCRWKDKPFTLAAGVCTGAQPNGIIS